MSNGRENLNNTKEILNSVSPSFCLAKWLQSTIHLQRGETHSCHHPVPHKIPIQELKNNPTALHNTSFKIKNREMMWNGEFPSECEYCWKIERLGKEYLSDRAMKSHFLMDDSSVAKIKQNPLDSKVIPQYIELSFSSECNFKCGYCSPQFSSRYKKELDQYGPVKKVTQHSLEEFETLETKEEDQNDFIQAWWKWWPKLQNELKGLRITGGEPLMHKNMWQLLESLEKSPQKKMGLAVNSNMGLPNQKVQFFSERVRKLLDDGKIQKFTLFTSIDGWGKAAEYLRTGLDIKLWEQNIETYIKITRSPMSLMITFNVLSLTSIKDLLEKILQWRKQYIAIIDGHTLEIGFDFSVLSYPLQYDMNILPKKEYQSYLDEALDFIYKNLDDKDPLKFSSQEHDKMRTVVDLFKSIQYSDPKLRDGRSNFYHWFKAMDTRRNTHFLSVFPEYNSFYETCRQTASKIERLK